MEDRVYQYTKRFSRLDGYPFRKYAVRRKAKVPVLLSAAPGPAYLLTLLGGTHTGFANVSPLFFWTDNVDSVGCAALSMAGLNLCNLPLPEGMNPQRQHDLTALATWNFIAMHCSGDLKKRTQAAEFLLITMPDKYGEEIAIQTNGK